MIVSAKGLSCKLRLPGYGVLFIGANLYSYFVGVGSNDSKTVLQFLRGSQTSERLVMSQFSRGSQTLERLVMS